MNRFNAIVSLVDNCTIVADIGTDHGYVAESLLKIDRCKKIIATDINEGPLNSAINNLISKGYEEKVDFRLGSGLKVLKEKEANIAIIAGMGGDLIIDIIRESIDIANSLDSIVIQAMTNIDKLRCYLYNNGFKIEKEVIVKELHHYYFVMKVVKGTTNIKDDFYYKFSLYLLENKDIIFLEYLNKMKEKYKKILQNLDNSSSTNVINKKEDIICLIKRIGGIIKDYEC